MVEGCRFEKYINHGFDAVESYIFMAGTWLWYTSGWMCVCGKMAANIFGGLVASKNTSVGVINYLRSKYALSDTIYPAERRKCCESITND